MWFYFVVIGLIALVLLLRAFLKPKGRRILFTTVSWLGFSIIVPGIIITMIITIHTLPDLIQDPGSWWGIWEGSPGEMILYGLILFTSYLGSILMLLGGIMARLRHFSTILFVIGSSNVVGFYGFLAPHNVWDINFTWVMITILPGMACIIGSLILKELGKQIVNQSDE